MSPHQLHNVYGLPEYADIQKKLHAKIEALQKEVGDTASIEDFRYVTSTDYREVSEDYYKDKK